MHKYLSVIFIIIVITFSSCKMKDEITGPPQAIWGKFVVDSIGTTANVKMDTVLKSMCSFISLAVVYHFEYLYGCLNDFMLNVENVGGEGESWSSMGPESVNDTHRFNYTIQLRDSLYNIDSVFIIRYLGGKFWRKYLNNSYTYVSGFSWKDSLYVKVER